MTLRPKDPQAVLDYAFDWSGWLAAAETISTATVTASGTGLVVGTGPTPPAPAIVAGVVTYWLSGGTVGTTYDVTCHITTSQGRTDDRTDQIEVRQR